MNSISLLLVAIYLIVMQCTVSEGSVGRLIQANKLNLLGRSRLLLHNGGGGQGHGGRGSSSGRRSSSEDFDFSTTDGTIKFDSFDGTKDSSSDDGYDSPRGGGGKHGGRSSSDDYDSTYEPKSTDNVVNHPGRNGRGGGRGHRGGRRGSSGHGH